jgi:hypothetical protein
VQSPRGRRALSILGVVALLLGVGWAIHRIDGAALAATIAGASLGPIALAMAINLFARTAARTGRTRALLSGLAGRPIGFGALFRIHLCAYAGGALLPGPVEEMLLIASISRQGGHRVRDLLARQAIDKSLGVLSVAICALPILSLVGALAVPLAVAAALAITIVAVIVHRSHRSPIAPRALIEALAWLVLSNALAIAMIGLCLAAVGVKLDPLGWIAIFSCSACASALPLTPGQLGVSEAAFVFALARFGVAPSTALAAGILYRLSQLVPIAIAGLPTLARWGWRRPTLDPAGEPCAPT